MLLDVPPTTVAGVAALLRYAYEFDQAHPEVLTLLLDDEGVTWGERLPIRMAEALERIAAA